MDSLKGHLIDAGSVVIAFSGGVDSTFLLAVAYNILGDRVVAATAVSPVHPFHELEEAQQFSKGRKVEHILLDSKEMTSPAFLANRPDRCYHCKKSLFAQLQALAESRGINRVAHGANVDDLGDYRPGFKAALEMHIWAPLIESGFGKEEIRLMSKDMGLSTWDKPTGACLATRIPYGSPITVEKLETIAQAESFLLKQGVRQCRVRHHGVVARIEADPEGTARIQKKRVKQAVISRFKALGFMHIALDLENYESGRMNRAIGIKGSDPSPGA